LKEDEGDVKVLELLFY